MSQLREQAATKEFLRTIAENGYEIPEDIEPFELAKALLLNMSSPDGELRDELSYMLLASGIIGKQKLTQEQLEILLNTVLDEKHLFYQIGSTGTNAIFMRSFSNLIIAAILYNDGLNPALPASLVLESKAALLRYAREEKDWRGYVEGKGWAHAMAHLADALDECAQNAALGVPDRQEILTVLSELGRLPEPLYNEEDVRLANVAYHMILARQLDDDFLMAWVSSCLVERGKDVDSWTSGANSKNFLRSLYFLLHWDSVAPILAQHISNVLKLQDAVYVERSGEA